MQMKDPLLRETQIDLMVGCLAYSLVMELLGLVIMPDRLSYSLGLLLGTLTALAASFSMYLGIMHCSGMDARSAGRKMAAMSMLRTAGIFLICAIGLLSSRFSFAGILIGLLGLKVSAYLHVYTNVYITRKLFRKYL